MMGLKKDNSEEEGNPDDQKWKREMNQNTWFCEPVDRCFGSLVVSLGGCLLCFVLMFAATVLLQLNHFVILHMDDEACCSAIVS